MTAPPLLVVPKALFMSLEFDRPVLLLLIPGQDAPRLEDSGFNGFNALSYSSSNASPPFAPSSRAAA